MSVEYSIWGIPAGETHETLLCEVVRGERITSEPLAEAVKAEAERRGYTAVRIVTLRMDMTAPELARLFR